jgi:hypothetical protein
MGRLIEFYVPDNFKPKIKWVQQNEVARVIEFAPNKSEDYRQPTWTFPEVDADLA